MRREQAEIDVLVAGAGPTGLMLALWLTRLGVKVRIIDPKSGPAVETRAIVVQARTLEFYDQLGLGEAALSRGRHFGALSLWVEGRARGRVSFSGVADDLTPHPYLYILTQDQNEALLIAALQAAGTDVEWENTLTDFTQDERGATATLEHGGRATTVRARYLAGCDGGRSLVRQKLGLGFTGGSSSGTFFVADTTATGKIQPNDLNLLLNHDEFFAVFPMPGRNRQRIVGIFPEGSDETQGFGAVRSRVEASGTLSVEAVHWFSTYRVHHRVAERFRVGRVFLLGDAGHLHSPLGGQGMNTGLGDAVNLGWKLAQALRSTDERQKAALLESYESERIPFARALIASTDRAFRLVSSTAPRAHIIRTHVYPSLLPTLARPRAVRREFFLRVAQTRIHYPKSPLSAGRVGKVRGGDRLPWLKLPRGSNFDALKSLEWQLQVYGAASAELGRWCLNRALPLHVFPFSAAAERAGFAEDALYLVRPDGYVGLALPLFSERALEDYAKGWVNRVAAGTSQKSPHGVTVRG